MDGSKQEIMEATYTALSKHGYAGLSIQKIADESEKAKSAIYYHYDDKEDLMLAFLNFIGENVRQGHSELEGKPAQEKLDEMLDMSLGIGNDKLWSFRKALLEMRAQAPHNEDFATKFREIDSAMMDKISGILDDLGVESPQQTAKLVVSCIEGAANRKASTGNREDLLELKQDIKDLVEKYITQDVNTE